MISGQCENLMIFNLFDGFSWFLGNVKTSWFSNTLTVFHDFWENLTILKYFDIFSWFLGNVKISWYFNTLMVFHDFWENLTIFKYFDIFSWFLGNVKISWYFNTLMVFHDFWENLTIFKYFDIFSWFLVNVKISFSSYSPPSPGVYSFGICFSPWLQIVSWIYVAMCITLLYLAYLLMWIWIYEWDSTCEFLSTSNGTISIVAVKNIFCF
jgi:hypothetical protein